MSDSLWPHGLQHARFLCPPLSPRVWSNSCPLSQWCYLTISSSAVPFSFCLNLSQPQGLFPMSQLFSSDGQSTGASATTTDHLLNIQGWFPLGLTGFFGYYSLYPKYIRALKSVFIKRARGYNSLDKNLDIVVLNTNFLKCVSTSL